jgi:hypothetical protein
MSNKLDKIVEAAVELVASSEDTEAYEKLVDAVNDAALLPGEPIFCVRGKDLVGPPTVSFWCYKAQEVGALPATLAEGQEKRQQFEDWQNDPANIRHVKVPT